MSPLTQPSRLFLRKTWAPMDPDAAAYIAAVEQADGQSLEETTKRAIDNFVLGCKSDAIWDAIKASCILAGARTLNGALIPLKGTAPTNFNFVSGDYNRKTGLVGNGSTKYLNSNRVNNADPQNSKSISVFISSAHTSGSGAYIGAGGSTSGDSNIGVDTALNTVFSRIHNAAVSTRSSASASTGFIGASRASSVSFTLRCQSVSSIETKTSETPSTDAVNVFRRTVANSLLYTNARLAFYSIGESLDLARLDARVSDLITAIGRAF